MAVNDIVSHETMNVLDSKRSRNDLGNGWQDLFDEACIGKQ